MLCRNDRVDRCATSVPKPAKSDWPMRLVENDFSHGGLQKAIPDRCRNLFFSRTVARIRKFYYCVCSRLPTLRVQPYRVALHRDSGVAHAERLIYREPGRSGGVRRALESPGDLDINAMRNCIGASFAVIRSERSSFVDERDLMYPRLVSPRSSAGNK